MVQAIPIVLNYRIDGRTLNCNAVSVVTEPSWDEVLEIKQLFPIDIDQITTWEKPYLEAISKRLQDIGHCAKPHCFELIPGPRPL